MENDPRQHPNYDSLEYEEQAAVHLITQLAEATPPARATLLEGAQAILDGKMFDEEGNERAEGVDEGLILVLTELSKTKSGMHASVLRIAAHEIRNEEHNKYHPEYDA